MDYQIWTKDEYDVWQKVECGDKDAAMREIDLAVRAGKDPLLTVAIPYKLSIKLEEDKTGARLKDLTEPKKSEKTEKEEPKSEASQGEAKPDQSTGAESKGKV
ncbi:hypothetical protein ES708_01545 [subsurface metagenome]